MGMSARGCCAFALGLDLVGFACSVIVVLWIMDWLW